ncbi:MAG: hypothetical protein ACLGRW_16860, partial [Acidobacteriota bacterium]
MTKTNPTLRRNLQASVNSAGLAVGHVLGYLWPDAGERLTRVVGWPGYKVYRHEIDEAGKRLKLWVRRKRGNKHLVCSGYGKPVRGIGILKMKAYLLKESLDRLWNYRYEGAMLRYLKSWIDQLRWRLKPMEKLADMLLRPSGGNLQLLPHQGPSGGRRGG